MKKIISTVIVMGMVFGLVSVAFALSDIDTHWAKTSILEAQEQDWIGGYPDGTFRPDDNISRAEFTKAFVAALDVNIEKGNTPFNDDQGWFNGVLNTAVKENLIKSSDYGQKFEPNKKITREEIARMMVRALGMDERGKSEGYVQVAHFLDVMGGYPDGTLGENKLATRAEAVVMIHRTIGFDGDPEDRYKIVIDGKEIPVKDDQIITPFNTLVNNLGKLDGDINVEYSDFLNSFTIYYTSNEGDAGLYNKTFMISIDQINNSNVDVRYLASMWGYDEDTFEVVKETLKVFYPTEYAKAFSSVNNTYETKGESPDKLLDNRNFGTKYFEDRDTVSIYIGGE